MSTTDAFSEPTVPEWRTRFLVVGVCAFWMILGVRLVQLQWFGRHEFIAQVEGQSSFLEEIAARPGDIYDRDGRVLATSIAAKSLFVVPRQLVQHPKQWEIVQAIAEAVGQDPDQLKERIARHETKHFDWVRRRITDHSVLAKLYAIDVPQNGPQLFGFRDEFLRQYPQSHLAAHVLGGRDVDGVGRGGIEQTLNKRLSGQSGHRQLTLDSRQRVIEVQTKIDKAPQHGQSVTLTLDTVIQMYVEEELDRTMEKWHPKHAASIVLDAKTGEVLAMGSRPTYDPNDLTHVGPEAWKNQSIAAIYEPGSTFKPMIVGWGLQQKYIRRDDSFHCENGKYQMGSRLLNDHHPYGVLSLTDVLVKSSNIGMAKVGQKMGNAELYNAAVTFGFGRRTGIELPGELSGMLHPLKRWTSYSTGSIPMGQEIAVTPIQLTVAIAALANGGQLISPHLVKGHHSPPTGRPWAEMPDRDKRTADAESLLKQIVYQSPTAAASRRVRSLNSTAPVTTHDPDEAPEALDLDDRFSPLSDPPQFEDWLDQPIQEEMELDSTLTSPVVSKTIDSEICRWLVQTPMTEVVKRGTGKKARLDDYTVFGKTGTAQKRDPRTGKYSNRLHVSSFVGGAPAANPRIIVLVMIDEPASGGEHFGGDIAAPPAREIIHKSLRQLGVPAEQKPVR